MVPYSYRNTPQKNEMDSWKKTKHFNEDESPNKEMEVFQPTILVFKVFMYLMVFSRWISEPSKNVH